MEKVFCSNIIQPTKTCGEFYLGEFSECNAALKNSYGSKVSLCYLDPPFCTGNDFSFEKSKAYGDKLKKSDFIAMMRDALILAHSILSEDGSVYLHIDYRMSAYMRLLLDEIFGAGNFRNEIIWSYNSGGRSTRHFPRKHDTIYFYSRSDKYFFDLNAVGKTRGSMRRNNLKRNTDTDGRVYFSVNSNGKEYRYYEDDKIYPTDVWTDIEHLHQRDSERTSYPTQKPLKLLSRIISASAPNDSYVCDLFSGSGTTAHAASMLGRNWIAVDKSPIAAAVLRSRLRDGNSHSVFHLNNCSSKDVRLHSDGNTCIADSDDILLFCSGEISGDTFRTMYSSTSNEVKMPECYNRGICITTKNGDTCFYLFDGECT